MTIGLTQTENPRKHSYYIDWLKGNDPSINVVTLSVSRDNISAIDHCHALVLSGGVDVDPSVYGSNSNEYPNAPAAFDIKRDQFETAIFKKALELNIPVLGICRGLQLVNCILGGTLKQDLGDDAGNLVHRGSKESDKLHPVRVSKGSLLHELTGSEKGNVNSAHHQAIDRLSEQLAPNCYSEDGLIEGTEWKDKKNHPLLLCVQWHPERMNLEGKTPNPFTDRIRDNFIEHIRKHKTIST